MTLGSQVGSTVPLRLVTRAALKTRVEAPPRLLTWLNLPPKYRWVPTTSSARTTGARLERRRSTCVVKRVVSTRPVAGSMAASAAVPAVPSIEVNSPPTYIHSPICCRSHTVTSSDRLVSEGLPPERRVLAFAPITPQLSVGRFASVAASSAGCSLTGPVEAPSRPTMSNLAVCRRSSTPSVAVSSTFQRPVAWATVEPGMPRSSPVMSRTLVPEPAMRTVVMRVAASRSTWRKDSTPVRTRCWKPANSPPSRTRPSRAPVSPRVGRPYRGDRLMADISAD